jgi:phosphohistidine phosphatase
MKHLYLLRHAKASWELAGELDYERGLTEKGQQDAALIAGPVGKLDPAPQLVICSGARRTRETLEGVAAALPADARVEFDDRIYEQGEHSLIDVVRGIGPAVETALLIGHNPGIHGLAVELAASGDQLVELAGNFPTATLAELAFDCPWSELAADTAELTAVTRVKQLRGAD